VGYSPELPNIQTFLTPQDVLALVTKTLRIPSSSRDSEIGRVLELVGLTEYRYVKVGKMSKGMVQRLSIAQAMLGNPEILILDEPMIGLDPAGTAHLRDVFHIFAKKDHGTVFMSSHMLNEVENLCDNIAIIHSGRLLISGEVGQVTRKIMGRSTITVEAEGLGPEIIEQIRKLDGVTNVEFDGKSRFFNIEMIQDKDLRPAIAELIVESKARLYTIKPADDILEKAYIKALSTTGDKVE
jgi:ABC-2 type transport system ATP-binding protein